MPLNFCRRITPDDPDLKWAIGKTGRVEFMWTIIPPGTEFAVEDDLADDCYFSIFKWTYPLWSALDIRIDGRFISYLRAGHSRREFNRHYQGRDYDYLKAPGSVSERPLPLGNHVISVCQAAGILLQKNRAGFFLSLPDDCRGNEIDAVRNALQNYLDNKKVPRDQIEHFCRYDEKKSQWENYKNRQSKKNMEQIWKKADVPRMKDIPADETLRERIRQRLMDSHKSRIDDAILQPEHRLITEKLAHLKLDFLSSTGNLTEEKVKTAARDYVRSAWEHVQSTCSE